MIERKWSELLTSLEASKSALSRYHDLMSVFSEMNDCLATMVQIEVSLNLILFTLHAFFYLCNFIRFL